jgi:hypothetical protein
MARKKTSRKARRKAGRKARRKTGKKIRRVLEEGGVGRKPQNICPRCGEAGGYIEKRMVNDRTYLYFVHQRVFGGERIIRRCYLGAGEYKYVNRFNPIGLSGLIDRDRFARYIEALVDKIGVDKVMEVFKALIGRLSREELMEARKIIDDKIGVDKVMEVEGNGMEVEANG